MPLSVTSTSCTSHPPSLQPPQPPMFKIDENSEYLRLPKSTLQTQVAHGAKSDLESDFNFETEYLIACSIPNKPPGEAILLQECLADYFTNIVQVRRQLLTPVEERPPPPMGLVNYSTKPNLYPSSSYVSSSEMSSSSLMPPPPYTGNGNGFYGDEKAGLKRTYQTQERNVAAWQVSLLPQLPFNSVFVETIVLQVITVLRTHEYGFRYGSPSRQRETNSRNLSQEIRLRHNPQTTLP
jgi:hypothetical protein